MAEEMSTEELLAALLEQQKREIRCSLPGRIESYAKNKRRASIAIEMKLMLPDGNGGYVARELPVLQNVPVVMLSGGGCFVSLPLRKGDKVVVNFTDLALGAWLQKGSLCEPGDLDLHGLGGAYAYPGILPSTAPLHSDDDSLMRLGIDNDTSAQLELAPGEVRLGAGATEALAIASKIASALNTLKSAISGTTIVAQDGGASFKSTLLAALSAWPPSLTSSNAKAKP